MREINGVAVLDTLQELTDPKHTALVVVDMQNDFCHADGHFAKHGKNVGAITAIVEPTVRFVRRAQELGIFVVFIQQQTLPNGRSDSPSWLRFKCRDGKSSEYTLKDSWGAEFVEGLVPTDRDAIVPKYRSDAFVDTTLDAVLRTQGIQTVVVTGTTTEGCVESTIRGASYHDYYVVPVEDLIASPNPKLHENSLELLNARYPVATSADVIAAWEAGISAGNQ
jgi:nicotinamidase-related amidase